MVGQEHDEFFVFLVPDLQPSQGAGIFSTREEALQFDDLIANDVSVIGNKLFLQNPVTGVVFLLGDEENAALGPSPKELLIDITFIDRHNRTERKHQDLHSLTGHKHHDKKYLPLKVLSASTAKELTNRNFRDLFGFLYQRCNPFAGRERRLLLLR